MDRPEGGRVRPNWTRIAVVGAVVVVLVGVVVGIQALSAPVERAGTPTVPVPSPSGTRVPNPSASPSASASTSGSAPASPSSSPSGTMKASGRFDWAGVTAPAAGSQGTLHRYAVAAETSTKLTTDSVATTIAGVLNDPRSWTGDGDVRFALVAKSKATTQLYLASGATAAELCGSDADVAVTCAAGDVVVINAERWRSGAPTYAGDLAGYRTYLINHAVGQLLGKGGARCAGSGKKAPVMMQQSANLRGCVANPWP
ncbi:MAG: DUF3152 domain-containing protein [Micropruina sp.]